MQCYFFMKRLRIPIRKKKRGVSHHAGKGSSLCLNASLQTEWILGILIQFSANILSTTFKMQCDWLPIQKKYRGRTQRNPKGETRPQRIYTCLSSVSLHSTVFASKTPFMLFPLPKKNTNEIQLQLKTQNMSYSRIHDIHIIIQLHYL